MRATRPFVPILVLATLAIGLAACAQDPLVEQYRDGSNKGFIAADGFQVEEIDPADRGDVVQFEGTLDTGATASSTDYSGRVLVVNFWYASCGPCIAEAPYLQETYESFEDEDFAFLGVNIRDQTPSALAFARDNGVTYPSLMASNDSDLKLAFYRHVPVAAVPSTLVIDRDGRVAARLIGSLGDASILRALVRDTLAESE